MLATDFDRVLQNINKHGIATSILPDSLYCQFVVKCVKGTEFSEVENVKNFKAETAMEFIQTSASKKSISQTSSCLTMYFIWLSKKNKHIH